MRNTIPNAMRYVRSHVTAVRCRPRVLTLSVLAIVLGIVSACGGSDAVAPKSLAADQLFIALRLSDRAINLALVAPYNTVQLHATPLAATGNALSGTGAVVYQALDTSVTVDTMGRVTALYTTAPGTVARVVAALQYGNITRQDTAYVQVTDTAPHYPLATFSIQPQPGGLDSAKTNAPITIPVFALDAVEDTLLGVSVSRLVVAWSVSDASIAKIDQNGTLSGGGDGLSPGRVLVTARTNAYGTVMQDTLTFTIGYSGGTIYTQSRTPKSSLTPVLFFTPSTLVIGVGTRVTFRTLFSTPIDVVFDDSTDVKGIGLGPVGNIPILSDTVVEFGPRQPGVALRTFPVAGTYAYHSRTYGTGGTIIVSNGP